jgi:hypothetical protein
MPVTRVRKVDLLLYHCEWAKKHHGYKTADSRLIIGLCSGRAKRPFFREILGVKVRVNLLAEVFEKRAKKKKTETPD